jgi:hypothetical protein
MLTRHCQHIPILMKIGQTLIKKTCENWAEMKDTYQEKL